MRPPPRRSPSSIAPPTSPAAFASFTGVGADTGSRLAAGGLNNPVVYDRLGSGLTVSQLITDFGRTSNLVASANLRAQRRTRPPKHTRADILLAVSRAYFALLRAESVLQVAEQTVTARQLIVDQITALAESKLKSHAGCQLRQRQPGRCPAAAGPGRKTTSSPPAPICRRHGSARRDRLRPGGGRCPPPLPDPSAAAPQRPAERPELTDLRLQESAAQRFVQAEHALYYPSIALAGSGRIRSRGQVQVPGRYGAVGVNVNIPIFNGGLFKARQAEADLRARAIGQNVTAAENRDRPRRARGLAERDHRQRPARPDRAIAGAGAIRASTWRRAATTWDSARSWN